MTSVKLMISSIHRCTKDYHKIHSIQAGHANKTFLKIWTWSTQCKRTFSANTNTKDYYKVLGVKHTAEVKEIKEAFYELSKQYHPDVNQEEGTLIKFREVAEAYDVLSNPIERKAHDKSLGLGDNNRTNPLKRPSRRFNGMHGEFVNGEFVDERGPRHRTIQYDLSPEKMAKVWERYQTRWNRPDEIERRKNLQKKKEQFRQDIDKKRAQMYNMSEAEREDFKHKMRVFSPGAANMDPLDPMDPIQKGHGKTSNANSYTDSYEKEEKMREKAKQQQQETKNREERERLYNEEAKNWEEEIKAFNLKEEAEKQAKYKHLRVDEDPFVGSHKSSSEENSSSGLSYMMSYINIGLKKSQEQMQEINQSQPFSYQQNSVKYGMFTTNTIKFSKVFISILVILVGTFSLHEYSNTFDEVDHKIVRKSSVIDKD